jgi:opacity protein-like surface antigen
MTVGIGGDYRITKHVFFDVNYLYYFGNGDLKATDFIGCGIVYRF